MPRTDADAGWTGKTRSSEREGAVLAMPPPSASLRFLHVDGIAAACHSGCSEESRGMTFEIPWDC
ncbi:hypothetical protein [Noviherbaspirillum cavernae]|nr:hypothetical protein [Noviherbaspirillum cavernae]